LPTRQDWADARRSICQGTLVGFFVGLLPGGGATISSYIAYAVAKQWSKPSQKFGAGAIGGVAAPEAAANAATCSGFIPLLTLGLPDNVVMALILGAFLLHGVTPGPTLMVQHPEMFWGIVTSMFIGNCMLIFAMLPLIGFLSKITLIPDNIVVAIIVLACLAGAYGVNNNPMDIVTMTAFGVLGYLMAKFGFPAAPMVLAFVLGPIMETSLRQSLIMSRADFLVFWTRPVSAALMTVFVIVIALPLIRRAGGTLLQRWSRPRASDAPSKSVILTLLLVVGLLGLASTVHAEDYPSKAISFVVPYPAGGRTDLTARAIAQFLKTELGQPVVVVNKPGASGVIGAKEVAGATPDGYMLGLFSTGFLTAQYMVPTPTNVAEYEFVALVNMDPAAIAVPRNREWKTLKDLIEYGRDHPGVLRVGINAGSSAHIFAAAFMDKAKLDVIYVPFRGGSERSVALAGGHIDVDFDIVAPMKPMVESNKIRVLAIASDKHAEEYPDIPTMAESGVNLAISSWHGVFAPRGTSKEVVSRLSRALEHVCGNAEFIAHMRKLLLGVHYLDTKRFREFFAESDRISLDLIRALGLYVAPQK
jgi:tripartite-type tricarboxylate transporter receptor subunit TctC